jgi:1-acyl-sn-glycerol-3-phosphate acyltransferase
MLIKIIQSLSYFVYLPFIKLALNKPFLQISMQEVERDKVYVLVPNHIGYPDSLILAMGMPYKLARKLIPVRYMVANKYMDMRFLGSYLNFLGGFPSHPHKKWGHGLEESEEIVRAGQTVVIFPEGRISKSGKREHEARRGVSVIAEMQDNVRLIPVRLAWDRKKGIIKSYKMVVGKPFDGHGMTPKEIMDVVYSLEFK